MVGWCHPAAQETLIRKPHNIVLISTFYCVAYAAVIPVCLPHRIASTVHRAPNYLIAYPHRNDSYVPLRSSPSNSDAGPSLTPTNSISTKRHTKHNPTRCWFDGGCNTQVSQTQTPHNPFRINKSNKSRHSISVPLFFLPSRKLWLRRPETMKNCENKITSITINYSAASYCA